MDIDEVKVCLRALLSSSPISYRLNTLLADFRETTGFSMPLFGCRNPLELLKTLNDTVQIYGDSNNPEVALIQSQKSAHITSLVDRQRDNSKSKFKSFYFGPRNKRQVVPATHVENLESSVGSSVAHISACSYSNSHLHRNAVAASMSSFQVNGFQSFPSINATSIPKKKIMPPEMETHSFMTALAPQNAKRSQPVEPELQNDLCIQNMISVPPPRVTHSEAQTQTQTEEEESELLFEPAGDEEGDNSSFEDVSCDKDRVNAEHCENNSDQALPDSTGYVNDRIKNKLKELIKNYPDGLWCCDLPQLFLEKYLFVLDYREYGYTSLIQMLSELPDVFTCVRPGNEDWILFDATVAPSFIEGKLKDFQRRGDLLRKIRTNLQRLFLRCREEASAANVEVDKVAEVYENMFGEALDIQSLGFTDLKSLLEAWEESGLTVVSVNGKLVCGLAPPNRSLCPSVRWEEALPPITAENDIFAEIFPKDVVGPMDNLVQLDLTRHVVIGQVIEVCIAEVWSPSKFFIQLNKFMGRLNRFMDKLQKFYNVYMNKYKMPDATIRPNQICVGLYSTDSEFPDEWHRAQILKVISETAVLVHFVDYGTVTRVRKSRLRFLHRSFQSFPVQACLAQLSGVVPPSDKTSWPMTTSKKFLELLRQPYFNAEIIDIDLQTPFLSLVLFNPFQKQKWSINEKLVMDGLAKVKEVVDSNFWMKTLTPRKEETKTERECSWSALPRENETLTEIAPQTTDLFSDIDELNGHETMKIPDSDSDRYQPERVTAQPSLRAPGQGAEEKEAPDEKQSEPTPTPSAPPSPALPVARKPPGLEHLNPLDLRQLPFLLRPDDLQRRINILAMELFANNAAIKQVGVNDPALALKVATEMAVALVSPQLSLSLPLNLELGLPLNFRPLLPELLKAGLSAQLRPEEEKEEEKRSEDGCVNRKETGAEECAASGSNEESTVKVCADGEAPRNFPTTTEYLKVVSIGGKEVHVVKLDGEAFVCAEEIVRKFTLFSNREVADRILHIRKIAPEYKVISKNSHEEVLLALKRSDIPRMAKKKSKKTKIYLLRANKVVPFLQALGCRTKPFENEFMDLLKNSENSVDQKAELL